MSRSYTQTIIARCGNKWSWRVANNLDGTCHGHGMERTQARCRTAARACRTIVTVSDQLEKRATGRGWKGFTMRSKRDKYKIK